MGRSDYIKLLMDYFPTAVHTGHSLVFISENWRVELREHRNPSFGQKASNIPVIRVKIFKRALNGDFAGNHYEDFQLESLNELAQQIERYVQYAVGQNIRENV